MSKKRISDSAVQQLVLEYIKKINKPTNSKHVLEHIQETEESVRKEAVEKALANLVASGEVKTKTYKKIVIYWYNQDLVPVPTNEEMKAMDEEITKLEKELAELDKEVGELETSVSKLLSEPSDEELFAEINRLQSENAALSKRIEEITSGKRVVTPEQKAQIEKALKIGKETWRKRKRTFSEIASVMQENMGSKRFKAALEDIGIETDEDRGVSLNPPKEQSKK